MKEKYKNILEKVYELEGLLLLALSKDEMPEGLESLIERKLTELTDMEHENKTRLDLKRDEPGEESLGDNTFYALEDEEEPERSKHPRKKQQTPRRKKLPVFSLNDRFLFLRELFSGDATAFNSALNRIAACDNFSVARNFLISECGLRPDDRETDKRFMTVIEEYFR